VPPSIVHRPSERFKYPRIPPEIERGVGCRVSQGFEARFHNVMYNVMTHGGMS